jgi:hypothetical protein
MVGSQIRMGSSRAMLITLQGRSQESRIGMKIMLGSALSTHLITSSYRDRTQDISYHIRTKKKIGQTIKIQ